MAVLLDVEHLLPAGGESTSTKSVAVPSGTTKIVVFAGNVLFNPRTVSGITFNTTEAFTAVTGGAVNEATPSVREESWFLDAPTITTANVVVTWSGPARGGVRIICLDDTADGQPAAVNTGTVSGSVAASTVAVNTTSGGIVLSGYTVRRGDATTAALTAGTDLLNGIGSPTAGDASSRSCAGSQAGTGASVSTTWTPTGTGDRAAHVVLAISATATGPTISTQPSAATAIVSPSEPAEFTVDCAAAITGAVWQDDGTNISGADIGQVDTLASGTSVLTVTPTATTRTGSAITAECTDASGMTESDAATLTVRAGVTETQVSETTDGSGEVAGTLATDVQGDALEKMVAFVAIKVNGTELVGPGMWLVGLAP